ncbi:hypothetical protein U1Q18_050596, partial [Sarracenia purpurea var. burkii]
MSAEDALSRCVGATCEYFFLHLRQFSVGLAVVVIAIASYLLPRPSYAGAGRNITPCANEAVREKKMTVNLDLAPVTITAAVSDASTMIRSGDARCEISTSVERKNQCEEGDKLTPDAQKG